MNMSIASKPGGALWPIEESRTGARNAMAIAIVAAVALEGGLIAAVMSMRVPTAPPTPVTPVMQMRFVKTVTPPPPPPPPPVIKKIVKRQSEVPKPRPVPRPVVPVPVPAPVPVATQDAPANVQAAPSAPAPALPAAAPGPQTSAPAEPADMAIVCPVQAKPDMPPRALAEGIVGAVTARATIKSGKVVRVDIVKSTPPGVFDASVRRAMAQYQCKVDGDEPVVVEQSFDFTETD
jgi:periplasmic protein TonB